jgi:hypothetical protein
MLALLLCASWASAGCRGTGQPPVERGPVPITVVNDLGRGSATIFVVPSGGVDRLIGSVGFGETTTLMYEGPTIAERLRLRALVPGERAIVSEAFIIPSKAQARWTLRSNRVTTPSMPDGPGR